MNSNKKTKVLITGGGGFLGLSIVKMLLKENYEIVSFSRSKYLVLENLNVTQIQGDLKNSEDIKKALVGIDQVIHTASKVGMHGSFQDFYETNFIGTKNLVNCMKELSIKKLVYTSTPSVVFGKDDILFADESIPYPEKYLTHYAHTKMLAEKYVLESTNDQFFAVSLRPHLIFGPGDLNLVPRMIEARKKNRIKIIGDGKNLVDVIYVENAAYAHLLALQKLSAKISGKSYFIGQGPVNLWTFTNEILNHKGLPSIEAKMPMTIAYTIGALIEMFLKLFRLVNVHPPMSRFIALQLGKSHYFNHEASLHDLGNYHVVSINEAIATL